jgi:glycosyltransferase involved in cell wall biosynthesis
VTTKVMHVITTLGPAGAETMLFRMLSRMDPLLFENEVISLTGILDLAEKMKGIGVRVRTLGMKKTLPNPLLLVRLAKWMRESRPDVIHTWMYHANLVGALAARLSTDVPLVWSIHHNSLDPRVDKRRTMLVNQACALASRRVPARIVCCSEAALRLHRDLGYDAEKLEVIPNGFDLDQVKPDPAAHAALRAELGVLPETLLIGIVARFHPHKDHRNFIRAAARLHAVEPDVHFVLCGMGVTWSNTELAEWIDSENLRQHCHLLGPREDVPLIFAGLDIAVTASSSEAFPIVIGEAMACGTPCAVTDVGDSAMIVGNTGLVVPPGDSKALAEALRKLLIAGPEARCRLGAAARRRVQDRFVLSAIVERYQEIYTRLAAEKLRHGSSVTLSEYAQ